MPPTPEHEQTTTGALCRQTGARSHRGARFRLVLGVQGRAFKFLLGVRIPGPGKTGRSLGEKEAPQEKCKLMSKEVRSSVKIQVSFEIDLRGHVSEL